LTSIDFFKRIDDAVAFFKQQSPDHMVRIISHLDTDGICSCALLIKALNLENIKYNVTIVPQLDKNLIEQFSRESYNFFIFSDLGSGQINLIKEFFKEKKVLILDHHRPGKEEMPSNIFVVNPHYFGINGSSEISGSGVVFYFVRQLNVKNEKHAHMAIIGALGDMQERDGFIGLNKKILVLAQKYSTEVTKGLRLFGIQSKPLHKILENCFDPIIPGVSGSETGTINFLKELGINIKTNKRITKYVDLTNTEKETLVKGIIKKRQDEKNPDDVFGNIYTFKNEKTGPFKDAREFSTLLNACGRLDKSGIGISALLGDKVMKKKAEDVLIDYRYEITNALSWYKKNIGTTNVIEGKDYILINSKDHILPTMVGTIGSILSRSNFIKKNKIIITMGRTIKNKTKISIRISGKNKSSQIDVNNIIKIIIQEVGGEFGGHKTAAGGLIDTSKEVDFIIVTKRILKK
jgi:single-stranded-DNA-specific exonuclease